MVIDDPRNYGYVLFGFVTFSYVGSCPFFYLAGLNYKKVKKAQLAAEQEG
jgi:hypothetical protein